MEPLDCYPEDFGRWDNVGYGIPRDVIDRVYVPLKPGEIWLSSGDYGFLYFFYYYELYGNLRWRCNDVDSYTSIESLVESYKRGLRKKRIKSNKYYEMVLGL